MSDDYDDDVTFFDDEEKEFGPLPNDEYLFSVSDVENIGGAKPQTKVTLKVAEGEHKGRLVFRRFSHKPTALWGLKAFIKGGGDDAVEELIVTGEGGRSGVRLRAIPEVMKGRYMYATLTEPDEGYDNNNIKPRSFRPADDSELPF